MRKMPGDDWQQLAGIRALLAYQWSHPGKQLLFMGCELGQGTEWAESTGLDWYLLDHEPHRGVQRVVRDLNRLYRAQPALWALDHDPAGFEWIDSGDADHNVLAYLRRDSSGGTLAVVINFAGVPHEGYRLALPHSGTWHEALNTDAREYGGSGVGNLGTIRAERTPHMGQQFSAVMTIPPLSGLFLVPD
jgi:1,4-alpha-glucan branching enzyme